MSCGIKNPPVFTDGIVFLEHIKKLFYMNFLTMAFKNANKTVDAANIPSITRQPISFISASAKNPGNAKTFIKNAEIRRYNIVKRQR